MGFEVPGILSFRSRFAHVPVLGDPGWVVIAPDETVTLYSTLTEMGQGIWSALAQIVNEELEADFKRVRVEMAPSWRAYTAHVGFLTGGSSSVPRLFQNMRTVGAAARSVLIEAAARDWSVPASQCDAKDGVVRHGISQRQATYGSLAARAAGLTPPASPPLKKREAWRFIGKSLPRVDSPSKVNGSARYTIDLQLPGMLVAAVSQSPSAGRRVAHIDRAGALASPGVLKVLELDDTVAIVARDYWSASRGLAKAAVKWAPAANPADTAQLQKALRERAETESRASESAVGASGRVVRATYEAPLLSHAQIEPMSVVARVDRMSAEIWAPAQMQVAMRTDVAHALGKWEQFVTVHTPLLGGAFGRRLSTEHAVTAARIANDLGAPVKVIWSRSEEFLQGRFRPMSAAHLQATLDDAGLLATFKANVATLGDLERVGALETLPYRCATQSAKGAAVRSEVRIGSWRSVDASQNVFFRECFIDECAAAAGSDPLKYRQALLAHDERALRVLNTVERMSGWGTSEGRRRFLGLAFHDGFGSPCAQVVEIERADSGALRVKRIFAAVDCGTAIAPSGIRAQIEGGALMGLSAALREEITFEAGAVGQLNFDTYQVLRMNEAPAVEIQILESPDAPIGGIGEAGVPPIAPALVNAVFAATQVRVRCLPLVHAGLKWA